MDAGGEEVAFCCCEGVSDVIDGWMDGWMDGWGFCTGRGESFLYRQGGGFFGGGRGVDVGGLDRLPHIYYQVENQKGVFAISLLRIFGQWQLMKWQTMIETHQ